MKYRVEYRVSSAGYRYGVQGLEARGDGPHVRGITKARVDAQSEDSYPWNPFTPRWARQGPDPHAQKDHLTLTLTRTLTLTLTFTLTDGVFSLGEACSNREALSTLNPKPSTPNPKH